MKNLLLKVKCVVVENWPVVVCVAMVAVAVNHCGVC